ncbi:hypothetical protein [Streptomyces sp. NPDC057582]|uniref:hypothetical protein n=1 Tax=Streptomyces sp. NPDC057582 TaxID=3346174 RepID=UPI0036906E22
MFLQTPRGRTHTGNISDEDVERTIGYCTELSPGECMFTFVGYDVLAATGGRRPDPAR